MSASDATEGISIRGNYTMDGIKKGKVIHQAFVQKTIV
jgi:hypothetical protein